MNTKMLFLGSKKYVFHIQMRQFITLRIHNINQMTNKSMYCGPNWKYLNATNPNLVLSRFINGNTLRNENYRLPPLMWQNPNVIKINIFNLLLMYTLIRTTMDKEFRLKTFIDGAKQAMLVVSNALGAQNYEELDSMVHVRALKVLKSRIKHLRPDQRQLIPIGQHKLLCVPGTILIKAIDDYKRVVKIVTIGLYIQSDIRFFIGEKESVGFANYVFQRTYTYKKSWTGGPWTVRSATHYA